MTEKVTANLEEIHRMEKDLRYIAAIIKEQGRKILSNYTITPPQFVALQWLFEHGDMTIGDLSNKMYLAFSTTTDLVDRMEKNDLVKRVRDEKDRRVVRIHLLSEGKRVIQEVIDKRRNYLQDVVKDFNPDELTTFTELLAKMHVEMSTD